uniref:Uncharacterized protein n=1 Tax=Vitrella brassicaformis TaxID=1169539 RepID=A0A7S1JNQ3_9ALVE
MNGWAAPQEGVHIHPLFIHQWTRHVSTDIMRVRRSLNEQRERPGHSFCVCVCVCVCRPLNNQYSRKKTAGHTDTRCTRHTNQSDVSLSLSPSHGSSQQHAHSLARPPLWASLSPPGNP